MKQCKQLKQMEDRLSFELHDDEEPDCDCWQSASGLLLAKSTSIAQGRKFPMLALSTALRP